MSGQEIMTSRYNSVACIDLEIYGGLIAVWQCISVARDKKCRAVPAYPTTITQRKFDYTSLL